eukprot:1939449-Prymnesium_polylepis.1
MNGQPGLEHILWRSGGSASYSNASASASRLNARGKTGLCTAHRASMVFSREDTPLTCHHGSARLARAAASCLSASLN